MATRAVNRASLPIAPPIQLPTLARPQVVNDDRFELDDEEIEALERALRTGSGTDDHEQPEDAPGDAEMVLDQVEEEPNDEEEAKEPVLSLAESLVLPYSLTSTRQHHLNHLLPHIFTHPVIPAHNRPRARGPPKSTFSFPTPPPPAQPLPFKEYHGPLVPNDPNTAPNNGSPGTPTSGKPKKSSKAQASGEVEPPAHEIECIARVTLTVGPISYPGTELWMGRFVEPRLPPPKKEKRDSIKRQSLGEASAPRRARPNGTPQASTPSRPHASKMAQTSTSPRRPVSQQPVPIRPIAAPRVPFGPPPPPRPPAITPAAAAPPRSNLPPTLIQRVNAAATQHPWLSVIIHKAARSSASREELAKLGRVVARLGRGEGVGEGPFDGPSTSGAGPSTISGTQVGTIASTLAASQDVGSSDSDSDVDMTGPKQVGGGSIQPDLLHPDLQAMPAISVSHIPSAIPVRPSHTLPADPRTPFLHPPAAVANTIPASTPASISTPGSQASRPPAPPAPYTPSPLTTLAPPPRPTYPLPPPFLLVAFKEAPTEKFLIPLGSQSFISRVGGDRVTDPPPPPPQLRASANAPSVTPAIGPEASGISTSGTIFGPKIPSTPIPASTTDVSSHVLPAHTGEPSSGRGRGRTRASLSRAKTEPPKIVLEAVAESDLLVEEPKKPVSRPDLPPLPGMKPTDGTVLISTLVPADRWIKPDWAELGSRLPFRKPGPTKPSGAVNEEAALNAPSILATDQISTIQSSISGPAPQASNPTSRKQAMLNLATAPFLPSEGDLQAVTIRLEGLNDRAWRRMKYVMDEVDRVEMVALSEAEPELLEERPKSPAMTPFPATTKNTADLNQNVLPGQANVTRNLATRITPFLRSTHLQRKHHRFQSLLMRVPPRSFLRYRLPTALPSPIEATSDKWAPRPYPISTKPLYTTDDADIVLPLPTPTSPELSKKRRRNELEPEVTFEMPVSLDALDERVAEGAMKEMSKGKRARGGGGNADDGRRKIAKRSVPGRVCEGCAGVGLKVWRRGPGGKGTLCMSCGDKYLAGNLGELKAPNVASQDTGEKDGSVQAEDGVKADDEVKVEVGPELETDDNTIKTLTDHPQTTTSPIPVPLVEAPPVPPSRPNKPALVSEFIEILNSNSVALRPIQIPLPIGSAPRPSDAIAPMAQSDVPAEMTGQDDMRRQLGEEPAKAVDGEVEKGDTKAMEVDP